MVGEDLDTLRTLAARLSEIVSATPGTRTVVNPLDRLATDLRVDVDRDKAGLLGVPTGDIDRTVRLGLAGLEAGTLREATGEDYQVRVRLPSTGPAARARQRLDGPRRRMCWISCTSGHAGAQVPLRQVATVGSRRPRRSSSTSTRNAASR